jgi:tetratricopeptide (TPR) repeat protein
VTRRWLGRLLFVPLCAFCQAQTSHVQQGMDLLRQERYADALAEFQAAQRTQPSSAAVENALGITLTKLNRLDEANQHYEQAIRLNSKLASPHKNLGLNALNAKQYELAESQLKIALALDPDDPFPHYYLALLYLATGREKEMVEHFAPARTLVENDGALTIAMATGMLRLNRVEQALELIGGAESRAAISLPQEFDLALLLRAKALFPQVVERLKHIAAAQPDSWINRYNLAIALLEAKRSSEAIATLETLVVERPDEANVWSLLGTAHEEAGSASKALDAYQRAVRQDPGNADRYLDYTRLLIDLDRYDESEQFVREGLSRVQDAYGLNMRLGSTLMMKGDYNAAREAFSKAIRAHPELALGYVALAQAYLHERREDAAARELARARTAVPADFMVEYYYGLALARLGRQLDAAAALERAVGLDPNSPEAHYELGKINLAMERNETARAEFERVISLEPQHANAHYQLSRIYAQLGDTQKASNMAALTKQLKQAQREQGLASQRARLIRFQPVEAHR